MINPRRRRKHSSPLSSRVYQRYSYAYHYQSYRQHRNLSSGRTFSLPTISKPALENLSYPGLTYHSALSDHALHALSRPARDRGLEARSTVTYTQPTHPTPLAENGEQKREDKDKDNWEKNQGQGVVKARRAAGTGRLWKGEGGVEEEGKEGIRVIRLFQGCRGTRKRIGIGTDAGSRTDGCKQQTKLFRTWRLGIESPDDNSDLMKVFWMVRSP
jgi:hypothetical protein